jgi:LysR family glycine cleavage system transcriptional activator
MKLPPLNALRTFEAAARTGSFAAAAAELAVSAAAVSLQVKKLEAYFQKPLFVRKSSGILLTDAGQLVYAPLAASLTAIAETSERILEYDVRSRLVISTIQSLAERWLPPILARFAAAAPGVGIEVRIDNDPVNFLRERIDLRLTYGDQAYPGIRSITLFHDQVTPLCTPAFASRSGGLALRDVPDERLIRVEWGGSYASYPTWADWFRAAGIERSPDARRGIRVGGAGIAVAMALSMGGVLLGSPRLARREIAAGLLVAPHSVAVSLPQPYRAIMPNDLSGATTATRWTRALLDVIRHQIDED